MTSVDGLTLTALNHAIEEALRLPCEYSLHEVSGAGGGVVIGVQRPTRDCGCGRTKYTVVFCAGCLSALFGYDALWCNVCGTGGQPVSSFYTGWEPLR